MMEYIGSLKGKLAQLSELLLFSFPNLRPCDIFLFFFFFDNKMKKTEHIKLRYLHLQIYIQALPPFF